ncbi:MAG: N-6 DNA methylase [Bacteroidetes bacterium]|nr:N-6 DNA methylase [Bacteroidota bacterium]MCL5026390.1 N-6 DNA methylase [Chloroflexota bacterium]
MAAKSKLRERDARMPDAQQAKRDKAVSDYLAGVKSQESESAKSQRFLLLLSDLFGLQPGFIEDYVAGVEKYVKVRQKDRLLRGKVDDLFGNLVIEFERDLAKTRAEAEEQLRRYVACLWSQERIDGAAHLGETRTHHGREGDHQRTPYLCLAADGVNFIVFSPTISDKMQPMVQPEDVHLQLIEQIDLARYPVSDVYFWLDRYFLRQEILPPKSDSILKDFGPDSHAFQAAGQALAFEWQSRRGEPEFAVVYESWQRYLAIAYGSQIADESLFLRHTYLATLAKLMAWYRLSTPSSPPAGDRVISVLSGEYFQQAGIDNFLEEDFFSWLTRPKASQTGVEIALMLSSLLRRYNLRELSEDVLKALYQGLVDPTTRHDLGEYYTPDWLADRMVRKLLADNPQAKLLDPSCGSGTFLYQAVREKRRRLGDTLKTLAHITESVTGIDIHPLAVITAKTNYLLALGDLLLKRRDRLSIPVYLSDAVKPLEQWARASDADYHAQLDDQLVYLPKAMIDDPPICDEAISAAREFAADTAGRAPLADEFPNFLRAHHPALATIKSAIEPARSLSDTMRKLIEKQRDSIWGFVLKNLYKPMTLRRKFDLVVGNPPWLSYRYVQTPSYRQFFKDQIAQSYGLIKGRGELITHLELGTYFLVRAADLYLKDGGTIAFVLPRSVFTSDQHAALREHTHHREGSIAQQWLNITDLWDLDRVEPVFNVTACVVFAHRTAESRADGPITGEVLSGRLPNRNASLAQAEQALSIEEAEFYLNRRGKRSFWATTSAPHAAASDYRDRFFQGATIVPRSFWFVQVRTSALGIDPRVPPVHTDPRAQAMAKAPYQDVFFEANVESRFLYATLLSTDMLPFGDLGYRLVVLPIEPEANHYRMLTAEEARGRGYSHLARWLERAQAEWETLGGQKERGTATRTVLGRLNYSRELTRQNPLASYRVLYAKSGTNVCACVVDPEELRGWFASQAIQPGGFTVDHVTYGIELAALAEATYLCALLNAPAVDRLVKPMQSRGLWGPRDVHKKLLDLPIPRYEPTDARHQRLAQLGEECGAKVSAWLAAGGAGTTQSIGRLRAMVRAMLSAELAEIDTLATQIMGME